MSVLKLFLLGPPRVELDGTPADIERRKAVALLCYLAVSGQPHSRDALATLFYPDHSQSRARSYLRRDLAVLNTSLDGEWLVTDRDMLELKSGYWLDTIDFRQRLTDCQSHGHAFDQVCAACLPLLTEAVDLYSDDFLAGFTLRDCPEFDDWQFFQVEGLRQELAAALEQLVQGYQQQGNPGVAIPHARRWVALDPLHEPAQQALIFLYDQAGQRSAALRQYEEYAALLEEELGLSPAEETQTLYEAIKAKPMSRSFIKAEAQKSRPSHGPDEGTTSEPESALSSVPLSPPSPTSPSLTPLPIRPETERPPHHLPAQPTPFIGREQELADVKRLLQDEPACRILTLVGPGGMGKTRLALKAASTVLSAFPHGVYFVPLASVAQPNFIVPAIAEVLHLHFQGTAEPKEQLLNYLRDKRLLLLIDNFEHLSEGVELLPELLRSSPQLKLLVTSRERLNLQEEWSFEVKGMPFPRSTEELEGDPQSVEKYAAIQLFLQRAHRAETSFALTNEDIPQVVRICQLVDGMPLGLELAAPWVRLMSCQEIADEIEQNIDILSTSLRDIPERHRSIRAIFEQTWVHLTEKEQVVLSKLSIFQGGCRRTAAEQVAGATLPILGTLVDKALLYRSDRRYAMHEVIRQFATEQLQLDPDNYEQVRNRHSDYYLEFLQQRTADLKGNRQKEALEEIAAEIDNVRSSWQRAIDLCNVQAIEQAAECLWFFGEFRGAPYEMETAFGQAVATLTSVADKHTESVLNAERESLIGYLLAEQGYLCARQHRLAEGQALAEEGLSRLHRAKVRDRQKEAAILKYLGYIAHFQGRYTAARQFGQESLTLLSEIGDRWNEAHCLFLLGTIAQWSGQLKEAEKYLQQCQEICREMGEYLIESYAKEELAQAALAKGEYRRANELLDEALKTKEEFRDLLGKADTLRDLGRLAIARGEYQQAVEYLQECVAIFSETGGSWVVEARLGYLGSALRLQGDLVGAEELIQKSLRASKTSGQEADFARDLSTLGCLTFEREEYAQAEQLQQEALAIWTQIGNGPEIASVKRYLGYIALAAGDSREVEVRHYFQQALSLAQKHHVAPVAVDVFVGVAKLLKQAGEIQTAVELLTLAEHHSASTYETKEKARRLLAKLTAEMSGELVNAAKTRGQALDWQVMAEQLADELVSPN